MVPKESNVASVRSGNRFRETGRLSGKPATLPETPFLVAGFPPDWVAGLLRNQWPVCSGITGRFRPEYAVNPAQQSSIDYVKEESHVLREQIGNKPLRLPIPRDGGLLKRPSSQEIQALVVRMAKGDPTWGYIRIRGTLHNQALKKSFGFRASRSVFPRSGFRFLKRWDYNSDYLRLPNEPLWKEH